MKVEIGGLTWSVSVEDAHAPELMIEGREARGTCWCGHQKIHLSKTLNERTALRVIRHEVVHAMIWSTQAEVSGTYSEEFVCEFVAMHCSDIIEVSQKIFEYFYTGTVPSTGVPTTGPWPADGKLSRGFGGGAGNVQDTGF